MLFFIRFYQYSVKIILLTIIFLFLNQIANRPVFISRCERDKTQRQGFKYSKKVEPNKIFIKGLSFEAKAADLYKTFSQIGAIKDIRIVTKK